MSAPDPHPPARRERHWSGDEVFGDMVERGERIRRDCRAGPLALLEERGNPVVRAAMTSSQRGRHRWAAVCVAVPLALFWTAVAIGTQPVSVVDGSELAGLFLCLWPLVCFLGAALRASGAVLDEVRRGTALQLVLTPLPARPLAASKVLPAVQPFLLGIVAALPLYCTLGASEPLLKDSLPLPTIFWPPRLLDLVLAPSMLTRALGMASTSTAGWEIQFSVSGTLPGVFMCLADLGLVWAGAHWGAAYAVRLQGLASGLAYLCGRLAVAALAQVFAWVLLAGSLSCLMPHGNDVILGLGAVVGLALLQWLFWLLVVRRAALMAIAEFAYFDRLADEQFAPRYLLPSQVWDRWDDVART